MVEVRVEAPSDVDDIVVRFADGHRDWLQAKSRLKSSGDPWTGLWADLAAQRDKPEFGLEDRLVVVLGEFDNTARTLRDLCQRTFSIQDASEWKSRLTKAQCTLLTAIERALGSSTNVLELLRRTTIDIAPLEEMERTFERRRLGTALSVPESFLSTLARHSGWRRPTVCALLCRSAASASFDRIQD